MNMSGQRVVLILGLSIVTGVVVCVLHFNQASYFLQRSCMSARGNWETREHSNEIGCRFPVKGDDSEN